MQDTINIMNKEIDEYFLDNVIEVKKIYNKFLHQAVKSEFEKMIVKHPYMDGINLVKHLFHGTRQNDPFKIYSFEHGLDMRYSNNGVNGIGLYFADNSNYSQSYCHTNNVGIKQLFMCTVITGLSSNQGGGKGARMPAPIPGKQGVLYDSFNNGNKGHYVIYDNQKSYPGYLISYK
ncbi:poly adp-ribose polymerase member 14-like protein [Stylonychia lemnae]|uniref:Poly [ADP-ribose] polymerase n=1 Tax=Stylonychia lemnae TaxID=5949 RepID=A0A078AAR6_STYLE|nr:poly adp-ribose polymerase member 14-like protein [Stylonychia lemnae]|eukprot:CDW78692.1 poly adp-ribose polymerase member 14-like protein [Stylonychia lemnae]